MILLPFSAIQITEPGRQSCHNIKTISFKCCRRIVMQQNKISKMCYIQICSMLKSNKSLAHLHIIENRCRKCNKETHIKCVSWFSIIERIKKKCNPSSSSSSPTTTIIRKSWRPFHSFHFEFWWFKSSNVISIRIRFWSNTFFGTFSFIDNIDSSEVFLKQSEIIAWFMFKQHKKEMNFLLHKIRTFVNWRQCQNDFPMKVSVKGNERNGMEWKGIALGLRIWFTDEMVNRIFISIFSIC